MLKKFAYNKILRSTGMLLLLLLLLLLPSSKKYSLEDKTLKTNKEIKNEYIYLIDKNNYVARTKIYMDYNNKKDKIEKILNMLIIDGKYESYIPSGFKTIIPSDVEIKDININENDITVNFSKEFLNINKSISRKVIELIIFNCFLNENINNIYIKVDDILLDKIPGTDNLLIQPLDKSFGVNIKNKINNYKDTTSTIIYYLNSDKNYYIPVTKINNSNKEKVELIIEELANYTEDSKLISSLNYGTKLVNYDLNQNKMVLNFNNNIFDNIENRNILDETINTINFSIEDNYNVKEIEILVNGNKINKK